MFEILLVVIIVFDVMVFVVEFKVDDKKDDKDKFKYIDVIVDFSFIDVGIIIIVMGE